MKESNASAGKFKIAWMRFPLLCLLVAATSFSLPATAEEQEDFLHLSTKVALDNTRSDVGVEWDLTQSEVYQRWVIVQGRRLLQVVPSNSTLRQKEMRDDLLATVYYEAHRAGLNPDWVLAIMQVESAFRKYAISDVGARGYMQVMPFWASIIGEENHNLFHLRTNIRYGTVILRHYIDIEEGNLFRALGRYNGSLGRSEYPNLVLRAYQRNWQRG